MHSMQVTDEEIKYGDLEIRRMSFAAEKKQEDETELVKLIMTVVLDCLGYTPHANESLASLSLDDSSTSAVVWTILNYRLNIRNQKLFINRDVLYAPTMSIALLAVHLQSLLDDEKNQANNTSFTPNTAADHQRTLALLSSSSSQDAKEDRLPSVTNKRCPSKAQLVLLPSADLATSLASHRLFLDGIRGLITILIFYDHFQQSVPSQTAMRIQCDTFLFIVLSGFTVSAAAACSASCQQQQQWNIRSFLLTRSVGLFPIFWLSILCHLPIYFCYAMGYAEQHQPWQVGMVCLEFVMRCFAVDTWTPLAGSISSDLYYPGVIWSLFVCYACIKYALCYCCYTVVKEEEHGEQVVGESRVVGISWKGIMIICMIVSVLVISYVLCHHSRTPLGFLPCYLLGMYLAYLYKIITYSLLQPDLCYDDHDQTSSLTATSINTSPDSSAPSTISYLSSSIFLYLSSSYNYIRFNYFHPVIHKLHSLLHAHSFFVIYGPDLLVALFIFILLYNNYTHQWLIVNQLLMSFGLPCLFAGIVLTVLLQDLPSPPSSTLPSVAVVSSPDTTNDDDNINNNHRCLFYKFCHFPPLILLGTCSYPMYLFQAVIMDFWLRIIYESIFSPSSMPFLQRVSVASRDMNSTGVSWGSAQSLSTQVFGFFLCVGIAYLVQKYYQDRWIMFLYVKYTLR